MSRLQARLMMLRLRRQRQAEERRTERLSVTDAVYRRLEAAYRTVYGSDPRVTYNPKTGRHTLLGRTYTAKQLEAFVVRLEATAAALTNPDEENA